MNRLFVLSSAVVLISKVAGFLRGVLMAGFLGTSLALDAYNGMLVIAGAIVFIVADQFEMLVSAEGPRQHAAGTDEFRIYAIEAVSVSVVLGLVLGCAAFAFIPVLTPMLVQGAQKSPQGQILSMGLSLLPVFILQIPSRIIAALLRGSNRASMSIGLDGMQGLTSLAFAVIALRSYAHCGETTGVIAVAVSQSVSVLLIFALQFGSLWRAIGASPLRLISVRTLYSAMRRVSLISGLSGLGYGFTLIDRHFAAKALEGGLSLVNYAGNISLTLRSILNYEQLYVIEFAKAQNPRKAYRRAVTICLWLTVPLSGVVPVFAYDIVEIVFQRGRFTAEMTIHAGGVLAVYGAATTVFLLWQLMFRILQIENRLKAMYVPYGLALILSLLVTPWAVAHWGLPGAIVGTICGTLVLLIAGTWELRRSGQHILPFETFALVFGCAGYSAVGALLIRYWLGGRSVVYTLAAVAIASIIAYLPSLFWWWKFGARHRWALGRGSLAERKQ